MRFIYLPDETGITKSLQRRLEVAREQAMDPMLPTTETQRAKNEQKTLEILLAEKVVTFEEVEERRRNDPYYSDYSLTEVFNSIDLLIGTLPPPDCDG